MNDPIEVEDEDDAPPPPAPAPRRRRALAKLLMVLGASTIALAIFLQLNRKPAPGPRAPQAKPGEESAFVGHYGYVISLPPGYIALAEFKDRARNVESVHFCKSGTDPTGLLDEGLYGQLGIVRLEVRPSALAGGLNRVDNLTSLASSRARQRGEKFTIKSLPLVSPLQGIQVNYDAPFPRVEAYILGHKVLYSFLAGEDDEIYRALLSSLRDAQSEL